MCAIYTYAETKYAKVYAVSSLILEQIICSRFMVDKNNTKQYDKREAMNDLCNM